MRSAAARALAAAVLLSAPSQAAPPEVPTAFVYQGVLTDAAGEPRTGNVDLKLRIYDAGSGGALLYVQSYAGVALDAGTFSIVIGPAGAAADPPAAPPLTTSLTDVFSGDLAATGPQRWLELQVGTSSALARTRLQATPFALRAGSAETADFADTSGSAGSADSVDGIPAEFVSQLWNHTNFDGNGPLNNDPLEGLGDPDGDGSANFIDADNDNDGVDDDDEIAAGKDPNLRTPTVSSIVPNRGLTFAPVTVAFGGKGLDPGFTATIGPLTLAPVNITPTGFSATVAALPFGSRALTVTNPNGQSREYANAFVHADAIAGGGAIDVLGAQQVLQSLASSYRVSTDGDFFPDLTFAFEPGSFRWDPTGRVSALSASSTQSPTVIRYRRDNDGDFDLADDSTLSGIIEVVGIGNALNSPSLAFDGAGRPGGGYVRRNVGEPPTPVLFHDRNGDGDFTDANELTQMASIVNIPTNLGRAAFDPAGRLMYAYGQDQTGASIAVAYDRTGDGDFADANESIVIPFGAQANCFDAAFDGHGHLAILHGGVAGTTWLRRDLNDDADFLDAGESRNLAGTSGCSIASGPGVDLAVGMAESGRLRILRDLNGDLDFLDTDESRLLSTVDNPQAQSMRIAAGARAFVGTLTELAITAP